MARGKKVKAARRNASPKTRGSCEERVDANAEALAHSPSTTRISTTIFAAAANHRFISYDYRPQCAIGKPPGSPKCFLIASRLAPIS
jgi:hypothetical protein